ncbi:MAG: hypothetical protein HQM08_13970 [Candidatus Riflebacteria bacterium]|nr:hypothetical protein [Candidatus Riflebacteria bacterium]
MRSGFVLPLVILAMLSVVFLISFINSMGSGYINQVLHVSEGFKCRIIAESVYSQVLAKIRNKPYRERFYANHPFYESNVPSLDGKYDLYVIDTPLPKVNQTDIYVQTTCQRATRLYFWRFQYESSILDAAGKMYPVIFASLTPKKLPSNIVSSPFGESIDQIIQERKQKNKISNSISQKIQSQDKIQDIITSINGNIGNLVDASDPASLTIPIATAPSTPPSIVQSIIFKENFEKCNQGAYPPVLSPIFRGYDDSTLSAVVNNSPGTSTNCYQAAGASNFSRAEAIHPVKTGKRLTYEVDVCFKDLGRGGSVGFLAANNGFLGFFNTVSFGNTGTIAFFKANIAGDITGKQIIGNWTPGVWQKIRVESDFENQTANVYIDGTLVGEKIPANSTSAYNQKMGQVELNTFGFGTANVHPFDSSPVIMMVDNIVLYQ